MDLETSYFQKCEHLNALEREIYSTRVIKRTKIKKVL